MRLCPKRILNLSSGKVLLKIPSQQFLGVLDVMRINPSGLSQQGRVGFDKVHPSSIVLLCLATVDSTLIRAALQSCP